MRETEALEGQERKVKPRESTKKKEKELREKGALKKGRKRIQCKKKTKCRTDTFHGGEALGGSVVNNRPHMRTARGRRRIWRAARRVAEQAHDDVRVEEAGNSAEEAEEERGKKEMGAKENQKREQHPAHCVPLPNRNGQLQQPQPQQQQRPRHCDFNDTALIDDPALDSHDELVSLLQNAVFFVMSNGDLLDAMVPTMARRKVPTTMT